MKLSTWATKQGIEYQTAWRWFKTGKLPVPAYKTPSGAILVQEATEFVKPNNEKRTYVYCRVSSHEKKDDLERQARRCEDFCSARGWVVDSVTKEIGSGMNDQRPMLLRVLEKRPDRLVVEYKDRLTRFGFNYFEIMLPKLGCELVVINRDSLEEDDLMKDLVAIITSFCCRLYGRRRGVNKAKAIAQTIQDRDAPEDADAVVIG